MKILLLGNDGRAHALAWKLINSPRMPEVICAPGNGGTAPLAPFAPLDLADVPTLGRWAFDELIDLILPASSMPLHAGLAEEVLSLQVGVCGASRRAAAIERRCRAKELMQRYGLPTAPGRAFSDLGTAERYLATLTLPVMIKADHPEGGEEVFDDRYAAIEGLRRLFTARLVEGDSAGVVIEAVLRGPRVVLSAFTDGRTAVPLLAVRLYDRVEQGDQGPRAAGIGAHTGSSKYAQQLTRYLHEKFLVPALAGLEAEGLPCWGVFGVDCIITADGPRATALRVAFREGEAQVLLPRLEDDLVPWIEAMIARRLHDLPPPTFATTPSVGLGLIARGYPGFFPMGGLVRGLEELDAGVLAFHSATSNPAAVLQYQSRTARPGGGTTAALGSMIGGLLGMSGTLPTAAGLRTTGGLVLTIVAQGVTLAGARARALVNADRVQFDGRSYRGDVGEKEFA